MSSKRTLSRRTLLKGAVAGSGALLLGKPGFGADNGGATTTTTRPYVLPSVPGVQVKAILTTGDSVNGYRMVGIPDGLGFRNVNGKAFELFMNHELPGNGVVRAHGSAGAFVSSWIIDKKSLNVVSGEDLTQSPGDVFTWNGSAYTPGTTLWNRLCSADMPAESAFRNGSLGTPYRIFMDGEETNFGRAWARIASGPNRGQAWELPRLGKMAYENVVACPHGKDQTIVALLDDGSINTAPIAANNPCEVFFYIGTKQATGSDIDKAGLTNGKFYGLRALNGTTPLAAEDNNFGFGNSGTGFVGTARFDLVELGVAGDVSGMTGLQIEQDAINHNVFRMLRVEDGAWDPRARTPDFYFVTTGSISANTSVGTNSRLWRLKFDDLSNPTQGGSIEILLSGVQLPAPGWRMFDNITIDRYGRILIQEDTGNNPWVARIWVYGIDTGELIEVAHHDQELFEPGNNPSVFITQDEESSGIIDAEAVLGRGSFLFVVQNHKANPDPELVEGGQLLTLFVHPRIGAPKDHGDTGHAE